MQKILVDSSVWIDYFRKGSLSERLNVFIDSQTIVICGLASLREIKTMRGRNSYIKY